MAAGVLQSRVFHKLRCHHDETLAASSFKPCRNPNPNCHRRQKRGPVGLRGALRRCSQSMVVKPPSKNLVMEHVKIIKRGEKLTDGTNFNRRARDIESPTVRFEDGEDLVLCSTDRLGPEPEMVQKQIRVSDIKVGDRVYAGTAFGFSPPPSSVPLPVSFSKKGTTNTATTDLRRLLRLDLS